MHTKAPHVTSVFIPDVVATLLALHVMEDGCIAAPEKDESMKKIKFIHVTKNEWLQCHEEYTMCDKHTKHMHFELLT